MKYLNSHHFLTERDENNFKIIFRKCKKKIFSSSCKSMRWLDISETLTILRTLRKRTKSKNSKADTKSRNQILRKIEDEGKPNQTKQLPLPITFYIFTQKTFLPPPPLVCFQIKIRRAFSEIGRKDKIVKRYSWWLVVYTVRWCQCFTEIHSSIWLERLNAKQNKI